MKTHSHLFGRIVAAGLVLAASAAHSQAQTPVEGGYAMNSGTNASDRIANDAATMNMKK
jgi:hypothetical protein